MITPAPHKIHTAISDASCVSWVFPVWRSTAAIYDRPQPCTVIAFSRRTWPQRQNSNSKFNKYRAEKERDQFSEERTVN